MTGLVVRDDLSKRTALSKSILDQFDRCQTKAWFSIREPLPFVPIEKVTFGSCLDAAIEVIVKYLAMGQEPDMARSIDAAQWVAARDAMAIDMDEIEHACRRFLVDVAPHHDWKLAVTQARLTTEIDGLGECDGHPDILLPEEIWDVKATTGKSEKDPKSIELGFYTVLREATERVIVKRVGYMEWRRGQPNGALKEGKWTTPSMEPTEEFRRWAMEKAAAFIRAKKADEFLNRKSPTPKNYSMTGGPSWPKFCGDCAYNPANGGRCAIAYQEEAA